MIVMASFNMGFSNDLRYDVIVRVAASGHIGNYAYGYLNGKGIFIVRYVGGYETDLKERIKHGIWI